MLILFLTLIIVTHVSCGNCDSAYGRCVKPKLNTHERAARNLIIHPRDGHDNDDRIIGGEIVLHGDAPWVVSIQTTKYSQRLHMCGGVIISHRWVLTAAHCVDGEPIDSIAVVAGTYNLTVYENTEELRCVYKKVVHPQFDSYTRSNDVALLEMKGGFHFNEYVQSIIFLEKPASYVSKVCQIYGWGSTTEGEPPSDAMYAANQTVLEKNKCYQSYPSYIHDDMLCANDVDLPSGPCLGDWGGPLVCKGNELGGIASWESGCSSTSLPSVFANATYFYSWVQDSMRHNAHHSNDINEPFSCLPFVN